MKFPRTFSVVVDTVSGSPDDLFLKKEWYDLKPGMIFSVTENKIIKVRTGVIRHSLRMKEVIP